jgi:hypothetical protein
MDTCRDAMAEKRLGSLIERRHDQCPKAEGEVADDVPENEKSGG